MRRIWILAVLAPWILAAPLGVEGRSLGILGRPAPAWELSQWSNLPAGTPSLEVSDFRGKVLYVFCFQSWCPGCHSHGFPTLQEVAQHFEGSDDVVFVAVQTVFEGFATNTVENGRETVEGYGLDIPVGHAEGRPRAVPPFMRKYRTGGTPWTILIDRQGVVRFNGFQISPEEVIAAVEQMLPAAANPGASTEG